VLLAKVATVCVSFDFCFCRMGELLDKWLQEVGMEWSGVSFL